MAADNKVLGQFDLMGIPPAPRGLPQIEVAFDIDANGIVHVTAKDKATNKEQSIRIQANGGLSDSPTSTSHGQGSGSQRHRRQGSSKDLVEANNAAESLIHSTEKAMAEHGDKIQGPDEKTAIETGLGRTQGRQAKARDRSGGYPHQDQHPGAGVHEAG